MVGRGASRHEAALAALGAAHEMVARDERARKWANGMPGGPDNPLGARALYLFERQADTLYRIHGTIEPESIGKAVSSGCIRMLNEDIVSTLRPGRGRNAGHRQAGGLISITDH